MIWFSNIPSIQMVENDLAALDSISGPRPIQTARDSVKKPYHVFEKVYPCLPLSTFIYFLASLDQPNL